MAWNFVGGSGDVENEDKDSVRESDFTHVNQGLATHPQGDPRARDCHRASVGHALHNQIITLTWSGGLAQFERHRFGETS